jgi:hypothetical protein
MLIISYKITYKSYRALNFHRWAREPELNPYSTSSRHIDRFIEVAAF